VKENGKVYKPDTGVVIVTKSCEGKRQKIRTQLLTRDHN